MAAWDEFCRLYAPVVFRVAIGRGFQVADAHDLVQEVMLSVARSVEQWLERTDRGSFRAWLLRIAHNQAFDRINARATRALGTDGSEAERKLAEQRQSSMNTWLRFTTSRRARIHSNLRFWS